MSSNYRGKALATHGLECAVCGADSGLEVHHVDGDRTNNAVENLLPLCTKCHRRVHRGEIPELSKEVKSTEERGYVYYQLSTPDELWEEWKNTVPRSQRLDERLVELIKADTDGRISEAEDDA